MGGSGCCNARPDPVDLLPLDLANAKLVGGNQDVTFTIPDIPGFSLTIKANPVTFPNGSKTGYLSVTQVHADKVPMVPQIGQQPRFIVTIQPPGVVFDPPAPITLPNVDGLAPGEKTNMYSFDHDLGIFVSIGTGTVSEDGMVLASDAGVGVVKAGWHCGGNPQTTGGAESVSVSISRTSISQLVATGSPTPIGNPAYIWTSTPQSGPNPPTVDYAAGNTSQTHPNTAKLIAPPNNSQDGGPVAGGLSLITVTYMCESGAPASDSIGAATFGVSCYNTPVETEFIDANGQCTSLRIGEVTYSGTTIDPPNLTGEFCSSFLAKVRLNGNGKTRSGQLIQTLGTQTFNVVSVITGKAATPVVADQTIAVDVSIIPFGTGVDLDQIGTGLLANDVGKAIVGYRIDLYRGFGEAVCNGWTNPIRLGRCTPGSNNCPK